MYVYPYINIYIYIHRYIYICICICIYICIHIHITKQQHSEFAHTTTHGNSRQHTATHRTAPCRTTHYTGAQTSKILEFLLSGQVMLTTTLCFTLRHAATHCNSLQLTATQKHIPAMFWTSFLRSSTHCNSLQLTATHCNSLQLTATQKHIPSMFLTSFHCNAL